MRIQTDWQKSSLSWIEGGVRYISIVFTFDLPAVARQIGWQRTVVGGPALKLMPNFFDSYKNVSVGEDLSGVLQRHSPMATRTSSGCIRRCEFCAVPKTEGKLVEFDDWPDLPVLIDNNLLACSQSHFDRVIDRLVRWGWADFNQGLDARLLTRYHAERLSQIKKPLIRLALDHIRHKDAWVAALDRLLGAGVAKSNIRSYALCGFDSDPSEAWARCEFIESRGIKVLPAWFTELDALDKNIVTEDQEDLGWNDFERRRIMQWFYHHKRAKAA